jgi:wyosine [tRNA(Phe)-imidazoG37] synthetase (radical SAM superfamily)
MCPTGRAVIKKGGHIAVELYRKIIDEAASFAIDVNLFGRGEALLHPDLPDLTRYAHRKGLNVRLETNATLLTPSKSEEMIRCGLDFISFSIDGYTKETYESIRVGAQFEETVQNIIRFLEIKKKLGGGKPFASIQFINTARFLEGSTRGDEVRFKNRFSRLPVNSYRYVTPHRYTGEIEEEVTGTRYGYVRERRSRTPFVKLRYTLCP